MQSIACVGPRGRKGPDGGIVARPMEPLGSVGDGHTAPLGPSPSFHASLSTPHSSPRRPASARMSLRALAALAALALAQQSSRPPA